MTYHSKRSPKQRFGVARKIILYWNKKFDVVQKVNWCRQKRVDVVRKSISCRQKQDHDASKKYFVRKIVNFFRNDTPYTRTSLLVTLNY